MQNVSNEYQKSMQSPLRERSYINVSLGLINQKLQTHSKLLPCDVTYFSNTTNIFTSITNPVDYATLETNHSKVDGSMHLLPRERPSSIDTGLVSKDVVTNVPYVITIQSQLEHPVTFKALTLNFADNYPVDFTVEAGDNVLNVVGNNKKEFVSLEIFNNVKTVKISISKMKNEGNRVRLFSIKFGTGLVFTNEEVINAELDTQVSPICDTIPQVDFSVSLKNKNGIYDADNPYSIINFLETGQLVNVQYGYQLPTGPIEWVNGGVVRCSDWSSNNTSATIRCQDVFRSMNTEYYKGEYSSTGRSYYDLATELLSSQEIEDYYLDPVLKTIFTKNPIPKVPLKEALQIVANACRCVLNQTRDGTVVIKSNFIPEITPSANTQAAYSNVVNITGNEDVIEYSTLSNDYSSVDGKMYILPKDKNYLKTGYVSEEISNTDCTFVSNPKVTLNMSALHLYYGFKLVFGNAKPYEFIIRTYNETTLIKTLYVKNVSKITSIVEDLGEINKLEIEFIKTEKPNSRIVLNKVSLRDYTDFKITRNDMMSHPDIKKREQIKQIVVPYYLYQKSEQILSLFDDEMSIDEAEETFFFSQPSYEYSATMDENTSLEIVESGTYFVRLKTPVTGKHKLKITGKEYKIVEQAISREINLDGRIITWKNPLLDNSVQAKELADWLAKYYRQNIEYSFKTRGNPELDCVDIIQQENAYEKNMLVNIYRHKIRFASSFSGEITTQQIGDHYNVARLQNKLAS